MQKLINLKNRLNARALVMGVGLMAALPAMAQETDPFDTAIATVTTKVTEYGGALVILAGVAVAFYVGIKFVKKIPKAA